MSKVMAIRRVGRLGAAGIVSALLITIAVTSYCINQIRIEGKIDSQAHETAELIADILPPPQFLVESFAEASMIAQDPAAFNEHADALLELRRQYDQTALRWEKSELHGPLKKKLQGETQAASRAFFAELEDSFLPAAQNGDTLAMKASLARLQSFYMTQRNAIRSLAADARVRQEQIYAEGRQKMWTALAVLGVLFLAMIATTIGLAKMLFVQVVNPIEETAKTMNAMAEGDLTAGKMTVHRNDEIGEMTRALEVFRASLFDREALLNSQFDERQRKNETVAIEERQQEMLELAERFEKTIGSVVSGLTFASDRMQATAQSMSTEAVSASQQTEFVSRELSEASANVAEAASACDQFVLSVTEISTQAGLSAKLAKSAASTTEDATATILTLIEQSASISKVVQLISDIADRTNLLALNASIEAARSGVSGRAFAVVAAEVKDLADRVASSAQDISSSLGQVEQNAAASSDALKTIAQEIGQFLDSSSAIAIAAAEQAQSGTDLARSLVAAAQSTDAVAANIAAVRNVSSSTREAAASVEAASSDLDGQAEILDAHVNQFLNVLRASG